ncbi:MAG: hypothetical protein ACNI25_07870 [Halarcobacter sp.]
MNKIFYIILTFIVVFIVYGVVNEINKETTKKEKRLPCQKETTTFEKIDNKHLIDEAINLLTSGNFLIKSRIEKATYMESKILNYISTKKADLILKNSINKYIKNKNSMDKKLLIDYYILENDKEDIGKKGTTCKLYAGYLVFEFKLDDKLIYKIQIDFMKQDTSDIPNRIDCVIKSFITLKGK